MMVDAELLARARDGDFTALQAMAKMAVGHVQLLAEGSKLDPALDAMTPWLVDALSGIALGRSPNEAFGYRFRRVMPALSPFLHQTLAWHVRDLVKAGAAQEAAIERVALAAQVSVQEIEAAVAREAEEGITGSAIPTGPEDMRRLQAIEERLGV